MSKIIEAKKVGYTYQSKYQKTMVLTNVSCSFEQGKIIVNLLCRLAHEKNYAVIVVTHNEKVAETADIVYGMSDGALEVVRG